MIDEVLEGGFRTKAAGTAGQAALLTAMTRRWHEGVISRLLGNGPFANVGARLTSTAADSRLSMRHL
jgi:hypothetical protein